MRQLPGDGQLRAEVALVAASDRLGEEAVPDGRPGMIRLGNSVVE
jgi:hypothetical protein